jgi:three-Cys-motif partner protein
VPSDEFLAADRPRELKFDEIGYWSELKLEIVRDYAKAYTTALSKQNWCKSRVYVDAFAGAGTHISRRSGEFVQGSPLNALSVTPAFDHFYFIDLDSAKADELRRVAQERSDVDIFEGDCNKVLLDRVFPQIRYTDFRRGLCLLDPYGLDLDWRVVSAAGRMRSLDVFLNFPVMDMNRNVLWHNPEKVDAKQCARLTRYWGDDSWRGTAYRSDLDLFDADRVAKVANEAVAAAFRERLRTTAGFANVPPPLPMRNSTGATIYYLFFASQQDLANNIVSSIFKKYAGRCVQPADQS